MIVPPSLLLLVFDTLKPEEPPLRYRFAKAPITIGRTSDNDIMLDSRSVSKRHAQLLWHGSQLSVEDLDSTNGIYVDGAKITAQRTLRGGEELFIGTFVLSLGTSERAPSDWGGRHSRGGHRPARLYIGYAPEDAHHGEALRTHLSGLLREGLIFAWHDQQVTPGDVRLKKQLEHLEQADAVVLLVSPHYLASEHCATVEMRRAFARRSAGQCCVLPILVRPITLSGTPLDGLQLLPDNGVAVSRWSDHDEAWVKIVAGIRRGLQTLQRERASRVR